MPFTEELALLLPADLPHREKCVAICALHLELIVEANKQFNLTRIVSPREAAIKHVVDSIIPWRQFRGSPRIADAGTGPGFPGIPLAVALPESHFFLLESTQKKARFVSDTVAALGLTNITVLSDRAEAWLEEHAVDLVTARAFAPVERAIPLLMPALKHKTRVLLYKGPDVGAEIAAAVYEIKRRKVRVTVVERYNLPDEMGLRSLVEVVAIG